MGEQEQLRADRKRVADGAEPRNLWKDYSYWRETTDAPVLDILDFYATYLAGQTSGLSNALSLSAVVAAFDIDGVEQEERPQATRMLLILHTAINEVIEAREAVKKR